MAKQQNHEDFILHAFALKTRLLNLPKAAAVTATSNRLPLARSRQLQHRKACRLNRHGEEPLHGMRRHAIHLAEFGLEQVMLTG